MSAKLCSSFFFFCFIFSSIEAFQIAKPGCKDKCGDKSIPYPFGIGSYCSIDSWAEVKCDTRFSPPKLFFTHSIPYEVVELSVSRMLNHSFPSVRIKHNISRICSDGSGAITSRYDLSLHLNNTPFSLYSFNQFYVIGCYMYGVIQSGDAEKMSWGCTTVCNEIESPVEERCNIGSGCCQLSPPATTQQYNIHVEALNVSALTNTRCGSAFLSDEYIYDFTASEIQSLKDTTVQLIYIMGNQSCKEARKDPSSFACKGNSECINYNYNGTGGYFCTCEVGHEGNPYLNPGCSSYMECNDVQKKTCKNKCMKSGIYEYYCIGKPPSSSPLKRIILGVGLGLFLVGGSVWMYNTKRTQVLELSEKLLQLKARLLLIQEISSHAKIFTAKRLENATNNFHESRILGQGGFGTVYKGILPDQSIVAVKKSKVVGKRQFDDFMNEVAILTKIDHRNIVKLLGCSVETEHPLLVYEFVSNGTLSDHIFKKSGRPNSSVTWDDRLRIAAEVAGALAYLHSAASKPIIHRDVKSSNILLDDHFTAKVADFGLSRVNHLDQTEIGTLVKGTPGYLDPEYIQTSKLTEKSDVFSFGVVLAELLTGKKSISFERSQGERNLAIYFNASMNEERLLHIVEEGIIVSEENIKEVQAAAALEQRCVNFKGDERPSMKEVASELEALRGSSKKNFSSQKRNKGPTISTSKNRNLYPTGVFNDGASGSSVAELTMSKIVAR